METIRIENIRCSDCGAPTTHKDNYDEGCCQRCYREHIEISEDIRRHEQKLANENYFGYPEKVPRPSIHRIEVGSIVKQRGKKFKVIDG